jgi:DNA mismatch endonuclease, patch repair protein
VPGDPGAAFADAERDGVGEKLTGLARREKPAPLNETVSRQMQKMRRSSTRPETLIRRELHRRGLRFRVNYRSLPGRPDVVFTSARIAIFVDGCFWHACPEHFVMPKNNREWWREKLEQNVARDRRKDQQLDELGWTVIHAWEHEDPVGVADQIEQLWRSRRSKATRQSEMSAQTL